MIPAAAAIPVPRGLDHSTAASLLVQGLTARILLEHAQTKNDDVVLIAAAAGGVGSLAVQLAKARGATVVDLLNGDAYMTFTVLQSGTQTAKTGRNSSQDCAGDKPNVRTMKDLLEALAKNPPLDSGCFGPRALGSRSI